MYRDANFSGGSLVKTADTWCLTDDNWNDAMSSIVIQATATRMATGKQQPDGDNKEAVTIYPNPANDMLTVYLGNSGYRYLSITDINGRTVITKTLPHDAASVTVDVSKLVKGVYSVLLKGGRNGYVLKKVVIEK
jgi:hypothetical protein